MLGQAHAVGYGCPAQEWGLLGLRRLLLVLGGVEHPGSHHLERIASAIAVLVLGQPVDRLGEGVGDRDVSLEVGQHLLTPATDGADEILPDLLLPLWDVVNPCSQRLLSISPGGTVPDVVEPLLVLVGCQELREGPRPGFHDETFAVGDVVSPLQQDLPVTLEGSALVGRQLLSEPLADLLQGFVGHTHNMELIDHDASLWQHRLDGTAVGLPHVHADDLDLIALGHAHEPLRHRFLLTTG